MRNIEFKMKIIALSLLALALADFVNEVPVLDLRYKDPENENQIYATQLAGPGSMFKAQLMT